MSASEVRATIPSERRDEPDSTYGRNEPWTGVSDGGLVLVTGAGGFVGKWLVAALVDTGCRVRAAVRNAADFERLEQVDGVDPLRCDITRSADVRRALRGVNRLYHAAALVDPKSPIDELSRVNSLASELLWQGARDANVQSAVYFSTAAVYGLLSRGGSALSETSPARAVEPYGASKLAGERRVKAIAEDGGPRTIVLRPTAIFGPGDRTHFGRWIRQALVSRLVVPGRFRNRAFSFVHVTDVARAALHLTQSDKGQSAACETYNVVVDSPVLFEDAFHAYRRALARSERVPGRARVLAWLSGLIMNPKAERGMNRLAGGRLVFSPWQSGFDLVFSSQKLLATGFRFSFTSFEDVLLSCMDDEPVPAALTPS